jgi:type II secretory pathway component PulM
LPLPASLPPSLPPTPDPAGWLSLLFTALGALAAFLVMLGGLLATVWRLMISPLKTRIDDAHVKLAEHAAALAKKDAQHLENLGHFSELREMIAAQPKNEDFRDWRRESREAHHALAAQMSDMSKRIDVLMTGRQQ